MNSLREWFPQRKFTKRVSKRIYGNVIAKSFGVLTRKEKINFSYVIVIQIFLGLLDLAGVAIIGLLGSLAITGVSNTGPGDRLSSFLKLFGLADNSLKSQMIYLALLSGALLVFKTCVSLYFTRKTLYFLARRSAQLSSILISNLLRLPILKIQERPVHETIYSLTGGVNSITVGILGSISALITDLSLLIFLLGGLFIVDTTIAISALVLFSLIGFLLFSKMQMRARQMGIDFAQLTIASTEKIEEVLNSYRELVVKDRRDFYASQVREIRFSLADITAKTAFLNSISKYVLEISLVVGTFLVAGFQFMTQTPSHAFAVLSIFLASSTRIAPAVLRIQQAALVIKANTGSALPALKLIETLVRLDSDSSGAKISQSPRDSFVPKIELNNVAFSYPTSQHETIYVKELEFLPGSMNGIVGPSGAGKSTLVDLLLGVLEPASGEIRISGLKPQDAIHKWPGLIGYVPQDTVIIRGTVRDNVAMGFNREDYADEQIWEALEIAHLAQFVRELPLQLDSEVGDRGFSLSGGQRQRLGIARSMFSKPRLLILYEATSSLDGQTEYDLSESLQSLKGNVTLILVAHRLSTIKEASQVIYMSAGRINSVGNFNHVRNQIPDFDSQARLLGM